MAEITDDTVLAHNETFCAREMEGEVLLLSADGAEIHTLDDVGSFIWGSIDGVQSLGGILAALCQEYEVDRSVASADLLRFVRELIEKDILKTGLHEEC